MIVALRDLVLLDVDGKSFDGNPSLDGGDPALRSPALYNLYNLLARGAAFGLAVNSARGGLGTRVPTGDSLSGESLYFQALRAFSAFDWELQRALLHQPTSWPLPRSLVLVVGRFTASFAERREEQAPEVLTRLRRAARVLSPGTRLPELRRLDPSDWLLEGETLAFGGELRRSLRQAARGRLDAIAERTSRDGGGEVAARLEAMIDAYTPLCMVYQARFDADAPERSRVALSIYLPAYHTLHAEDLDRPEGWYLERGLPPLALPSPVQISGATITQLSYLQPQPPEGYQGVKLELSRCFGEPRVRVAASFGRLLGSKGLLGVDCVDPAEALHVRYRPSLPAELGDNLAARSIKEAFNHTLGAFDVDARIHRLALRLERDEHASLGDADEADALLRPRFRRQASRISFRAHRATDNTLERMWLRTAGFEQSAGHRQRFWRDFRSWEQLRAELFGGASLGVRWQDPLLSPLVGLATEKVIDRSIRNIEQAIDEQLAKVVSSYLERYARARRVLARRLHQGLFEG